MKYDILLLDVTCDYDIYYQNYNNNIGQYLIAAYLRKFGYKGYVYSGNVQDCIQVITNEIQNNNVGIIGFYAAADNIRTVKNAIKWIKKNYPKIITVVGGPQAIDLDFAFFNETLNDFAIIGEGEIPILYLVNALTDGNIELSKVPSLVRKDDNEKVLIVNECKNAIINNLDEIPFPSDEDSLKNDLRKNSSVGILTGRGCPNNCAFCFEGANAKNVRFRSLDNVFEEIDYITVHNRNLKYINVYDDTFTLDKERVTAFAYGMKERGLKWLCEGHLSFAVKHPEIIEIMVDCGLLGIQFGLESGSNEVLKAYNKNIDDEMMVKAVENCKKAGVRSVSGNFIIGGANETRETLEKSKNLAKRLIYTGKGIMNISTVYFAPYPNTKMTNYPEKFNITILEEPVKQCVHTMGSPVIKTTELSIADIYYAKKDFCRL